MEYKILDKSGVIISRQPETVTGELSITFTNAPDNATAVFKTSSGTLYRPLQDNACTIPFRTLTGEIEVTVTVLNGKAKPPVYKCEGLKAQTLKSGEVLVLPNDMDLPSKVTDILIDMQDIRAELKDLSDKYSELGEKLDGILEGYDIT
ncbi:MAG: hypothetical protein LUD19_06540 [Clostridia bacterium]|nr:hypothetical protein [Clostridia bacterium]